MIRRRPRAGESVRGPGFAFLAVAIFLAGGCAPPPAAPAPAGTPTLQSTEDVWAYAIDLVRVGDDAGALAMLERAAPDVVALDWDPPYAAPFYRDLAELRLAAGRRTEAEAAARGALEQIGRIRPWTQFQAADRRLAERLAHALAAGARADVAALDTLCRSTESPPVADACYLLGDLRQRQGETEGARAAFLAYLDRVPEFGFLRRQALMRGEAERAVRR